MELRSLPSLLLSTLSPLFYIINLCDSVAPADLPPGCPTVSTNQRALLDSCCYSTLLPDRWNYNDEDEDGRTWMPVTTGDTNCPQRVMVSNATNDWLITQYINTTLSSGESASDVEVNIQFTCTGSCSSNLALLYYPTNTPLEFTALSINMFMSIGQAMNGTNPVTGINTSGFFLAIQAMGAIFVTVDQISIIPTICRAETINLINFPEAYPIATNRVGSCTADSEQSSGSLTGSCGINGMWETSSSCVCIAGYFMQNDSCTACPLGTYKSNAGNEPCSPCPQNSDATSIGSTICSCRPNHMRPNSNADEGCTVCIENYFLSDGGSCEQCPQNSTSSRGANICTCFMNYTTMNGSRMTTGEDCVCGENYHLVGSNQCVQCPANSLRAIMSQPSMCTCESNHLTGNGSTTTSGSVACDGCRSGYFRLNGMCLDCPENSNNIEPLSNSCTCKGQTVTVAQSNITIMENCSTCPENWKSVESFPLVCDACPSRSERPTSQDIASCRCTAGYEMKLSGSECFARVIIPPETVILKEGSFVNPAEIFLNLSARSYGFSVSIGIDTMLPTSVNFAEGKLQASIEIPGNDAALNNSYNLMVEVLSGNDYVGEGEFKVTIVDDDFVSIGFLDSQRKTFNESENDIIIILTKNVTTAQNIQVNLVFIPEGSSLSVENPMVTLAAGPPDSTPVTLQIQQDSIGGEPDESVILALELVSPMDFSHLINLNQLEIIIKDDDVARETSLALDLPTIIGIAVAGAAVLILIFLILLVSICICRFNASRQGFYITDEDKTANPPSMLRYSASLRSISSQAVVPIIDGKGQLTEKENEFYV